MSKKTHKRLNKKQKAFADHYILTQNAYDSAKKAGYSEGYAKNSYKLLEHQGIKDYIRQRTDKIVQKNEEKTIAEQEDVLRALSKIVLEGYDQSYHRRKKKWYEEGENGTPIEIEEEYRKPNPTEVIRASERLADLLGMTVDELGAGVTQVTIINDTKEEE